jgi:hypothetical protein
MVMVSIPNAVAKVNFICQGSHSYAERGDIILQKTLAGVMENAAERLRSIPIHPLHHRS